MPKLSQNTLKKRFECPFCRVTLRTRQGLSGHIQFKHAIQTTKKSQEIGDEIVEVERLENYFRSTGSDEAKITLLFQVRKDWILTRGLMEADKTKLSDADFKTFQLISYAMLASEKRLKAWLTR